MSAVFNRIQRWFIGHEKALPIIGAIILALTYTSKEIVQANLESRTRRVESFLTEARLIERIDALQPDLRKQLSHGTDQYKKLATANAEIFLNMGASGGSVPFSVLVDIKCDTDYACRAAELFRHREVLYSHLGLSDEFARQVSEPSSDEDPELSRLKSLEQAALNNITRLNPSDGNLMKPTNEGVDDYAGRLVSLESAVYNRDSTLRVNGWSRIETLEGRLHLASVVSAVFYFIGWALSFFGLIYGPAGAGAKGE